MNVIQYLIERQKANMYAVNNTGKTILHISCIHFCEEIVRYLIETLHMETMITDNFGRTPYHYSNTEMKKYFNSLGIYE